MEKLKVELIDDCGCGVLLVGDVPGGDTLGIAVRLEHGELRALHAKMGRLLRREGEFAPFDDDDDDDDDDHTVDPVHGGPSEQRDA